MLFVRQALHIRHGEPSQHIDVEIYLCVSTHVDVWRLVVSWLVRGVLSLFVLIFKSDLPDQELLCITFPTADGSLPALISRSWEQIPACEQPQQAGS